MDVIYWQVSIAITVMIAYAVKRELALIVCILWTIFTIDNVYYEQLIMIQLFSTWIPFLLLSFISSKNKKIEALMEALPDVLKAQVETVSTNQKQLIAGLEHVSYLNGAIKGARHSVVILSGWISDRVVDNQFLATLRSKLDMGVHVYIGYGWQNSQGSHKTGSDHDSAVNGLKRLALDFPNQLNVGEFATHEKTLIIDSRISVFGSANWLSNKQYKNSERSIIVTDTVIAESEHRRIVELVQKHKVV